MKLLSLLFVFRMMHVAVCSCRLRRVRPVCGCELLVDWNFPGTQFVVENFTFLFPLDKYFSFTMKCAPSLALSAKLKNKPKLNESSSLCEVMNEHRWFWKAWNRLFSTGCQRPKMLMLDNQQALCSIMCNTKDSTQFFFLSSNNEPNH